MKKDTLFQWSDNYRIGHDRIDQGHQYVFDLLHKAHTAASGDDNPELVHQLLNSLLDFSHVHFMEEEALMQSMRFSGYEQHTRAHLQLIQKTEDFLEELKLGYAVMLPDILDLLQDWIKTDILIEDVEFGRALSKRSP